MGRGSAVRPTSGGSLTGRALAAGQVEGSIYQRDMRKRLREVTELAFCYWIVFFGEQAHIVTQR
jgi:hypothetical protein